jgi:DNA-binding NarL/FixJ family response regulator
MNIKVVIADDHPMVVEGIQKMLANYSHIMVTGSYGTGAELLEGLKIEQPDILLLDIHFPDTTGNNLVRAIAPLYSAMKILVITSVEDPFEVQDMMQNGCSGFIRKAVSSEMLVEAIEAVYHEKEFIEPSIKEMLLQSMIKPGKLNPQKVYLTAREQEVLELICDGLTNIDIGAKLFLSHRTVENHRISLYHKFEVNNTASLVKLAVQYKLVQ